MAEITSRDLRYKTRSVLDRVADGERLNVTLNGRAVAELAPVTARPTWMHKDRFVRYVLAYQADATLTAALASLVDETTDDLPRL